MFLLAMLAMQEVANNLGDTLLQANPLENWEVISAFLLPLVMAVIIQSNWSRKLQSLATFGVALLWTVIVEALRGNFGNVGADDIVTTTLKLFALSIPFYYGLWKPLQIAPGIEARTNFSGPAAKAAGRAKLNEVKAEDHS